MALELFSATLIPQTDEINNSKLLESINDLSKLLNREPKILCWDENHIAIPIDIQVALPPLGNYDNIDIRAIEPVIIVLNTKQYPVKAPRAYPDRLDFPKNQLAHLYVSSNGRPPAFCLVRDDINEWYSNKQIKDLVIRIENWLRDATTGDLTEDGGQFEPLRLEGYHGISIYDYDMLASIVNEKKSYYKNENFAIGLFEKKTSEGYISFDFVKCVTHENLSEIINEYKKENEKEGTVSSKKFYHFGYILWSLEETVFEKYSVNLPRDWDSFKLFCEFHSISTKYLEVQIAANDLNRYIQIPVIVAIKRPTNIIGFSSNIELINFFLIIDTPDVEENNIINNVPVKFQKHNQPLTLKKAKEVSGFHKNINKIALVAGCGALGSKVVIHLARSGMSSFLLSDSDIISPHNMVRHALLPNSIAINKAHALTQEIKRMFPSETLPLIPFGINAEELLSDTLLQGYSYIFDFTASNSFFQNLVNTPIKEHTKVFTAYISDFGNLGIMFCEGKDRNPRIDDLQTILYAKSRELKSIAAWLKREDEVDQKNVNIKVGVGCNSETIVLADDVVSMHASFFSGCIKTQPVDLNGGKIYLNEIHYLPFFHNTPTQLEIPSFHILQAKNDSSWQIRMVPGIIEQMRTEMKMASPKETGGVFIGRANYKTKTIHVIELIKAPTDSKSNATCFFRGIKGLPETIKEINELSGNQLGYIGEWHSHPHGPNGMSTVDSDTVTRFKNEFEELSSPLPVFLMIITPEEVLPYVF